MVRSVVTWMCKVATHLCPIMPITGCGEGALKRAPWRLPAWVPGRPLAKLGVDWVPGTAPFLLPPLSCLAVVMLEMISRSQDHNLTACNRASWV